MKVACLKNEQPIPGRKRELRRRLRSKGRERFSGHAKAPVGIRENPHHRMQPPLHVLNVARILYGQDARSHRSHIQKTDSTNHRTRPIKKTSSVCTPQYAVISVVRGPLKTVAISVVSYVRLGGGLVKCTGVSLVACAPLWGPRQMVGVRVRCERCLR